MKSCKSVGGAEGPSFRDLSSPVLSSKVFSLLLLAVDRTSPISVPYSTVGEGNVELLIGLPTVVVVVVSVDNGWATSVVIVPFNRLWFTLVISKYSGSDMFLYRFRRWYFGCPDTPDSVGFLMLDDCTAAPAGEKTAVVAV